MNAETRPDGPILADLRDHCRDALTALDGLTANARRRVTAIVAPEGTLDPARLEREQFMAHGLAWLATYHQALTQLLAWYETLDADGRAGETEALLLQIGFGEYLAQILGGIPMSQNEICRPQDLALSGDDLSAFHTASVRTLVAHGNTAQARHALSGHIERAGSGGAIGDLGLDEDTDLIRAQFHRFAEERVVPHAHRWHSEDAYIPMDIIGDLAELGVFGLTIPEDLGGAGFGKLAMCVVSEELSRGYIGVGSLGTRAEIAAELIMHGGTDEQKSHYLPRLASGEILPTAVFTEPNTGSDLGSLRTRAKRDGDSYRVTGNKTWITHAARADLMTLLVRTDPESDNYRGLSMLLAEKPRGDDDTPFPAQGMTGGEIEVLGYRGMKEFELSFDDFEVPATQLLGDTEGQGFKQLMQTFESARIQTAARALGVAQNAFELGLRYAQERAQFGKPLFAFPRVHGKLAMMAVEIMIARQLTYHAAREKDAGHRCDLEAGMAKLLAARIAWSNADNALQIHGGNGFALEYEISRVLCDSRILNIFEGAAEIQAQVIARRLLG